MASLSKKQKKTPKPPKGRPQSTSIISQPAVEDTTQPTALSSFSPDGNHFAFLSLAVDKHRLRVYHTETGQSLAEHIVDTARVSSLSWGSYESSEGSNAVQEDEASPNKKKRRKRNSLSATATEGTKTDSIQVVTLGLSDGTVLLFSPTHGRVLQTLSHSSSSTPILSVAVIKHDTSPSVIWTSSGDGAIRVWDPRNNSVLSTWKTEDRIPYSAIAPRPSESLQVLVAHHSIRLVTPPSDLNASKLQQLATLTGHASPIRDLQWDASLPRRNRFFSFAESDRFIYLWEVPEINESSSKLEGKTLASIPLDSDVRGIALAIPPTSTSQHQKQKQVLLTLSASGKISIYPIPTEIVPPASTQRTQHKVPTLTPRSNLSQSATSTTSKKAAPASPSARIVDASFASGEEGHIRIARVVGGLRPVFDNIRYLDESGEFISEITIEDVPPNLPEESTITLPTKRYNEANSVAIRSGIELGHDETMDDLPLADVDGTLDVDLAELSLGQRLNALSGKPTNESESPSNDSDSDDEAGAAKTKPNGTTTDAKSKSSKSKSSQSASVAATSATLAAIPANSLTRTLIQALHSSDSRLVETCLSHSDPTLIRNTVRRLPPQLAVPLINACVERLGRGKRAGSGKGGGAGSSAQRGMGLITWVRTVLAVHSGHLMTIPDLVARLSGLHSTLTARLALHESLLTLSGKLDMVLSQIEMRSSVAPAPLTAKTPAQKPKAGGGKAKGLGQEAKVKRYVEGESSSSEDEKDKMDVEIEKGGSDDEGSIEDVELGGASDDSDEDEGEEGEEGSSVFDDDDDLLDDDDEEDEDDEDEDDDQEATMNGFINEEAEEDDEEYSDVDGDEDGDSD
ncbi:hypothetical protein AX16_000548 [Volvariella volvacea WC 439]|nr:hypothetical protein AX16_000548 [Volvariella volvacea WC 439]